MKISAPAESLLRMACGLGWIYGNSPWAEELRAAGLVGEPDRRGRHVPTDAGRRVFAALRAKDSP